MKRSWIGFGLLLLLLAASLLVTAMMTRIHEDISLELLQASECALLGEWENVQMFQHRARRKWEKWAHFRACFSDHTPAENIDAGFAAMDIYRRAKDATAYRSACAGLTVQIGALGEAHALVWWNLL